MKPLAKRVTIQKPVQKKNPALRATDADGFERVSESTIRKVYN